MRSFPERLASVVGAVLLVGCGDPVQAARDEASKSWTCPADRVQATKRDDLDGAEIYRKKAWRGTPPPDVAADPARKAMFEAEQNESIERNAKFYADATLIEVRGCGKEAIFDCRRRRKVQAGQNWFMCSAMP